jgi:SAM-dependent methyltransferase
LYDLPEVHDNEYDIVFTSYGVLCWLHDIRKWGQIISHFFKPEGLFLLVESHPFLWIFNDESKELQVKYSYWHDETPLSWELDGTYADENAKIANKKSYEWQYTISDILNSLIDADLKISHIGEYPHLVWRYLPIAEKVDETYYKIPGDSLPQTWSVKAIKRNIL